MLFFFWHNLCKLLVEHIKMKIVIGLLQTKGNIQEWYKIMALFFLQGTDTSKLEKLMVKMGIFSALYIIPAITMVVCDSYHMFVLMRWHPTTIACKQFGGVERGLCKRPQIPQASAIYINSHNKDAKINTSSLKASFETFFVFTL